MISTAFSMTASTPNKKAFSGEEIHYIGSLELPLSKLYPVYTKAIPAGKKVLHAVDKIRKK